jgi:DNA-binding XRE family transcriptional regulator
LVELRSELGLARAPFARLIGCSERALASWEAESLAPNEAARRQIVQLRRLLEAARHLMAPNYVGRWLVTPNEAFGGLKPVEVVERGEIDRLWRALFAAESGAPV